MTFAVYEYISSATDKPISQVKNQNLSAQKFLRYLVGNKDLEVTERHKC